MMINDPLCMMAKCNCPHTQNEWLQLIIQWGGEIHNHYIYELTLIRTSHLMVEIQLSTTSSYPLGTLKGFSKSFFFFFFLELQVVLFTCDVYICWN